MDHHPLRFAPHYCHQNPGGGYDLVAGVRRRLLMERVADLARRFSDDGALDTLQEGLEGVLLEGVAPEDLDGFTLPTPFGELALRCGREGEWLVLTIALGVQEMVSRVAVARVVPLEVREIPFCPLVGEADVRVCGPSSCPAIQQLRQSLAATASPEEPPSRG